MKTPKALLEKTGYSLYVNDDVLATIPRSTKKQSVEVFKIGKYITDDELEKEYETRGLVPADLDSILSVESKHNYIGTHWKDSYGKWCYLTFSGLYGKRRVRCSRYDGGWDGFWFLSGVRKSSDLKSSALHSDTQSLEKRIEALEHWKTGMQEAIRMINAMK